MKEKSSIGGKDVTAEVEERLRLVSLKLRGRLHGWMEAAGMGGWLLK